MNAKRLLIICAIVALVLGLGGAGAYFLILRPAQQATEQMTQGIADRIGTAFNLTPQISINSVVVVEERKSAFEIAVLSQKLTHRYTYENTTLFSTKRLFLNGVYVVKAGFNLTDHPFAIDLHEADDAAGYLITVTLPVPEILSVEMERYEVQLDEDGWWNEITAKEREIAVNTMNAQVREKALQSGILKQARQEMQSRMEEIRTAAPFEGRIRDIRFQWVEKGQMGGG